jgi:hypothetical protein
MDADADVGFGGVFCLPREGVRALRFDEGNRRCGSLHKSSFIPLSRPLALERPNVFKADQRVEFTERKER